jgi:hypothetical protein
LTSDLPGQSGTALPLPRAAGSASS